MRFTVLTLFPDQVSSFLSESIIGRAVNSGILEIECVDIRDFTDNKYGKVDDTLYGGGTGMLMACQPVFDAHKSIPGDPYTVFVSPKGHVFDQKKAIELSKRDNICILCGHYEGIDARVLDRIVDEEISIGDFVLTGGEIAAVTIIDAVSRMIPGVLPNEEAYTSESHMSGVLEAPQYTKPAEWEGMKVPQVLLSGDQAKIDEHNRIASLVETWSKRPDMLDKLEISEDDWQKMLAYKKTL
ncbi:MAG: tRNA (guanosine(37)-N1)-methyltransferase TrmD [Clostridiales bacterium]|nr:tRNA (guanosine(37)-N1)-methyltransferase TrmD [Clostridiales bacterium]